MTHPPPQPGLFQLLLPSKHMNVPISQPCSPVSTGQQLYSVLLLSSCLNMFIESNDLWPWRSSSLCFSLFEKCGIDARWKSFYFLCPDSLWCCFVMPESCCLLALHYWSHCCMLLILWSQTSSQRGWVQTDRRSRAACFAGCCVLGASLSLNTHQHWEQTRGHHPQRTQRVCGQVPRTTWK